MNEEHVANLMEPSMFFYKYYDTFCWELSQPKKIFLGDRQHRKCRFCGADAPTATFRKTAHAFPQLIGNSKLISLYECDSCNEKFDKILENNLGNYLGLERTLSGIKGKKGVPKFKSPTGKIKIETTKSVSTETPSDKNENVDKRAFQFHEINDFRASYIPRLVYKSFVKMALSIMPEKNMCHFKESVEWIMKNPEDDFLETNSLICFLSFVPGPLPFRHISARLWIRKNQSENVPYSIFAIAFANYVCQIFIPFCDLDKHLEGQKTKIAWFTPSMNQTINDAPVKRFKINLSSNERETMEQISMVMAYRDCTVQHCE